MKNVTGSVRFLLISLLIQAITVPVLSQEEDDGGIWSVTSGVKYLSKFTNNGVDLSRDQQALSLSAGIAHASGLSFEVNPVIVLGSNGGYQQSSFALAYEKSFATIVSLGLEFAHYSYKSDTANALAGLANSFSVDLDFDLDPTSISLSYSRYLGGGGASFFSVGISTIRMLGDLAVIPVAQATFANQTVSAIFLTSNKGKSKAQIGTADVSISGLSSLSLLVVFSYPLVEGLSASFTPAFTYTPTELAARSSQFVWSAGLTYSMEF
ncbi:MAG: hypothetical protein HW374_300 [Bacteroidetes bacterium]|nr:hypothetical protein [Bacteroidota bacterium]